MRSERWMMKLTIGLFAIFPAALAAAGGESLTRQIEQLAAMTPTQFEAAADVKDDSLETVATITTRNGWQLHEGMLGIVTNDGFFRAFVDKKTGSTRFQVYHAVHYLARRRISFETVNYETPAGPVSTSLTLIARTRDGCRRASDCSYEEIVGFDMDEALLRTLALQYRPGHVVTWKYRLEGRLGVERDAFFSAAEIAGILAAVDRYRATHGLAGARP